MMKRTYSKISCKVIKIIAEIETEIEILKK